LGEIYVHRQTTISFLLIIFNRLLRFSLPTSIFYYVFPHFPELAKWMPHWTAMLGADQRSDPPSGHYEEKTNEDEQTLDEIRHRRQPGRNAAHAVSPGQPR